MLFQSLQNPEKPIDIHIHVTCTGAGK